MHPWIHTRFLPCVCMCICVPLPAPDFWQELLLPLPHKQQALILPSAGFTLFLALLSCLPADMPSLYLVSLAASPLLPKLVLFIKQLLCWSMVSSGEELQGPNAAGIKTAHVLKPARTPPLPGTPGAQLGTPENPRTRAMTHHLSLPWLVVNGIAYWG